MSGIKRALVTGITGQDGHYLAEFLFRKGYEIHGVVRSSTTREYVLPHYVVRHTGDITDGLTMMRIMEEVVPDEVYNLAAQTHVGNSFVEPGCTAMVNAVGAINVLEATRHVVPESRFYQASTSEMFGHSKRPKTWDAGLDCPFKPRSPYGAAKLHAHNAVVTAREAYGFYACAGVLFNHESPRRGANFVTQKIARYVGERLFDKPLALGNIDARRDWGHAKDYVRAMWLMLQQDKPNDYVIATGEHHSVKEFCEAAFRTIGIELVWNEGKGYDQTIDKKKHQMMVYSTSREKRPLDIDFLCGDSRPAREVLGWKPEYDFDALVADMVRAAQLVTEPVEDVA